MFQETNSHYYFSKRDEYFKNNSRNQHKVIHTEVKYEALVKKSVNYLIKMIVDMVIEESMLY